MPRDLLYKIPYANHPMRSVIKQSFLLYFLSSFFHCFLPYLLLDLFPLQFISLCFFHLLLLGLLAPSLLLLQLLLLLLSVLLWMDEAVEAVSEGHHWCCRRSRYIQGFLHRGQRML
jgi:hypothetical protein